MATICAGLKSTCTTFCPPELRQEAVIVCEEGLSYAEQLQEAARNDYMAYLAEKVVILLNIIEQNRSPHDIRKAITEIPKIKVLFPINRSITESRIDGIKQLIRSAGDNLAGPALGAGAGGAGIYAWQRYKVHTEQMVEKTESALRKSHTTEYGAHREWIKTEEARSDALVKEKETLAREKHAKGQLKGYENSPARKYRPDAPTSTGKGINKTLATCKERVVKASADAIKATFEVTKADAVVRHALAVLRNAETAVIDATVAVFKARADAASMVKRVAVGAGGMVLGGAGAYTVCKFVAKGASGLLGVTASILSPTPTGNADLPMQLPPAAPAMPKGDPAPESERALREKFEQIE